MPWPTAGSTSPAHADHQATSATSAIAPVALSGPTVWAGPDISNTDNWSFRLDPNMLGEIDAAVTEVTQRQLPWWEIRAEDFPLPRASTLIENVRHTLEHGRGIAKLTGLELDGYTETARRALFFGIGANLGTPVSMSREGMLMSDVTDEGAASAKRYGHVASDDNEDFLASRARVHSTGQLRFHNDRCDVVALMCVAKAKSGGENRIASVPKIHNKMLERRPDLVELLYQDYHRSRLGEEFGDNAQWYSVPIFASHAGHFTSHYSRTFIEAAQLNEAVPKMSPRHWEAIELMAEIADEVAFETTQQPGEIQFLNNHVIFHSRTPYQDYAEPARKRLLHRLWISVTNSRPLPESYAVLFGDTAAGALRGGIAPAGNEIRPMP